MHHVSSRMLRAIAMFLATFVLAGAPVVLLPDKASAHCDSAQGPVVMAARKALDTGEIKWALAYVPASAEGEMAAAFKHALEVRKLGGEAHALADRYFAETTVRLHRMGEGAGYTGIKENPEITPGLEAAEKALETGDPESVFDTLEKTIGESLEHYWHQVVEARERAEKEGTVEALRAKATAELVFELVVFGIEQAAHGHAGGEGGDAAGGHSHGAPAHGEDHQGAPAEHHGETDEHPIGVHLKGVELPVRGIAVNGKALVPLRAIAEALGGEVTWDDASHTVSVRLDSRELVVRIDDFHAYINGRQVALPVAPALVGELTMVPGHLMAEFLGLEFSWNAAESVVEYVGH